LIAPDKADTHQLGKDPLAPLERLFNNVTRSAAPVPQFFPRMPSLGRQKEISTMPAASNSLMRSMLRSSQIGSVQKAGRESQTPYESGGRRA
jgi:hypothetical protein